jgi:hypothetical protein
VPNKSPLVAANNVEKCHAACSTCVGRRQHPRDTFVALERMTLKHTTIIVVTFTHGFTIKTTLAPCQNSPCNIKVVGSKVSIFNPSSLCSSLSRFVDNLPIWDPTPWMEEAFPSSPNPHALWLSHRLLHRRRKGYQRSAEFLRVQRKF